MEFAGSKVALVLEDRLVAYKRDDKPTIPHPGKWDLPGGGREGFETPFECMAREVAEEFGLSIASEAVVWRRSFPSATQKGLPFVFFVATITQAQVDAIAFGSEGERWEMMAISRFIEHPDAVPGLQAALKTYQADPTAALD